MRNDTQHLSTSDLQLRRYDLKHCLSMARTSWNRAVKFDRLRWREGNGTPFGGLSGSKGTQVVKFCSHHVALPTKMNVHDAAFIGQ